MHIFHSIPTFTHTHAPPQAITANLRDHASLRTADALGAYKAQQGFAGLAVDPAIHDQAPSLDSILPPSAQKGGSIASSRLTEREKEKKEKEGEAEEDQGYQISEYKMAGDYEIKDYKSIYDK